MNVRYAVGRQAIRNSKGWHTPDVRFQVGSQYPVLARSSRTRKSIDLPLSAESGSRWVVNKPMNQETRSPRRTMCASRAD